MNVYEFDCYKNFLRESIRARQRPGIMTDLARAAGCDRTYLSQVLSGKAQLTPDHALNLGEALDLGEGESDFFLLLLLKARCSQPKARQKLERRLERLRKENLDLSKKIKVAEEPSELSDARKLRYYSNWKFAAAHILVSLPAFQTVPTVARALGGSEQEAAGLLDELSAMGLVKRSGGRFSHGGANLHIPAASPLVTLNHLNWRMRAMESASGAAGLHYTDVFSVSEKDGPVLTALVLEFVEKLRRKIRASGAETAHAFTCDFFPLVR